MPVVANLRSGLSSARIRTSAYLVFMLVIAWDSTADRWRSIATCWRVAFGMDLRIGGKVNAEIRSRKSIRGALLNGAG